MAASWLAFLPSYPELILAATCFFFLLLLNQIKKESIINWPIVGMFPAVLINLNNFHYWITAILRESAGYTKEFWGPWFLGMDFILTCDPANVNHVFNTNFANYPKGDEFAEIFDILGDGIFNADGESWRSQRKKGHTLMSHPKFRSFVAKCSRDKVESGLVPLLSRLADQQATVDLQDVFLRLTFDMTCNLVFGVDLGGLSIGFPTIPFAKAMDDAMEALFVRHVVPPPCWKLMRWLMIGKEKKLSAARGVMDDFAAQCIAKSREAKNHEGSCLLSSYIKSNSEDEKPNSIEQDDKFLRDTAVNLMLAGRDTTGSALAWFFWLLSKNPAAEEKIIEELQEQLKKMQQSLENFPILFDADELAKLVYLHAALCESLRLYPPVPFEHKMPLRSEVLPSGVEAASGRKIMFSTFSMGRMEGVWGKECLEFRPERWISEEGRLRHEPAFKFLSFNCGPRICLGKDVAFTQMKVAAAAIICNFDVVGVEGHAVEPKPSVILQMKNGWMVNIKKRDFSKVLHGN